MSSSNTPPVVHRAIRTAPSEDKELIVVLDVRGRGKATEYKVRWKNPLLKDSWVSSEFMKSHNTLRLQFSRNRLVTNRRKQNTQRILPLTDCFQSLDDEFEIDQCSAISIGEKSMLEDREWMALLEELKSEDDNNDNNDNEEEDNEDIGSGIKCIGDTPPMSPLLMNKAISVRGHILVSGQLFLRLVWPLDVVASDVQDRLFPYSEIQEHNPTILIHYLSLFIHFN